jgi:hypothetical protein
MDTTQYKLTPVAPDVRHIAVISQYGVADDRCQVLAYDEDDKPWVLKREDEDAFLMPMAALFGGWESLCEDGRARIEVVTDQTTSHEGGLQ